MRMTGNTVLVTGGTSGIGMALVERFAKNGNTVITCARGEDRIAELKKRLPEVVILRCDMASGADRRKLAEYITENYPEINILVNNAGIQQKIALQEADKREDAIENEISINLIAPIELSTYFIPLLKNKDNAFIVNVTSGLAFMPSVSVPVYCATKAGMHSFTFSLREQLADTGIGVAEIIPPAVDTNLGGAGVHAGATNVNDFADAVWSGLENGDEEIGYGMSLASQNKTRTEMETMAKGIFRMQKAGNK